MMQQGRVCWGRTMVFLWTLLLPAAAGAQAVLVQASYLFENDDGPNADNNTPQAGPETPRADVLSGERLTVRIRIDNVGDAAGGPLSLALQLDHADDTWIDLQGGAALEPAFGSADFAGATTTLPKTAPCPGTLASGGWWQGSAITAPVDPQPDECIEVAFVLATRDAPAGATIRLRLVDAATGSPLEVYSSYPTLTMRTQTTSRYSTQVGAVAVSGLLHARGAQAGARFGAALARCDVDGDGEDELVVGLPGASDAGPGVGRVDIFDADGIARGWALSSVLVDPTPTGADGFGGALAAGDVNGDGRPDVVIGAPTHDGAGGRFNVGQAVLFVQLSDGSGFEDPVVLDDPTPTTADAFGTALVVGDVNGDGRDDVIVGSPHDDSLGMNVGEVLVFLRNAANTGFGAPEVVGVPDFTAGTMGHELGVSLAAADVDADGRVDIVAGARFESTDGANVGRAYVLLRNAANDGFDAQTLVHPQPTTGDSFGTAVATGHVGTSSTAAVVVGAPLDDTAGRDQGAAYVFVWNDGTGAFEPAVFIGAADAREEAHFGSVVAWGDVDGDGLEDLVIGAPGDGGTQSGRIYISYQGAGGDLGAAQAVLDPTPSTADGFGSSLAVWDSAGLGVSVAAGAPGDDALGANSGEVVLLAPVLGRDGTLFFDAGDYARAAAQDGAFVAHAGEAGELACLFAAWHADPQAPIVATWDGASTTAAWSAPVRLDVLRRAPGPAWEPVASQSDADALTAIHLDGLLTTATADYTDPEGWTVWRVSQLARDTVLLTDAIDLHFSVPGSGPPAQADHSPSPGSVLDQSALALSFTLDKAGDCRWSLVAAGYTTMTRVCDLGGARSQTCWLHDLPDGTVEVFVGCRDLAGNADTQATATTLSYVIDTVAPPPATEVNLDDPDATAGMDGRDLAVSWSLPATVADVAGVEVYILPSPAAWSDGTSTPVAVTDTTATTWSGSESELHDSYGNELEARPYVAYVVTVDAVEHRTASAASNELLPDDDRVERSGQPAGDGCGCAPQGARAHGSALAVAVLLASAAAFGRRRGQRR